MIRCGLGLVLVVFALPAQAEVVSSNETGFIIEVSAVSVTAPDVVWAKLIRPAAWWSSQHSWSGDATNMSLDPDVGGCFCERWAKGAAEHGRVIHSVPNKMLRLSAPLGPLQGMAVAAVLTFELKPNVLGTAIKARYSVSGHFDMDARKLAPSVDAVIREQMSRLAQQTSR
jgi:uncharacterized protein YndB with AHSA1/START domain